jgi:hypothetical protein
MQPQDEKNKTEADIAGVINAFAGDAVQLDIHCRRSEQLLDHLRVHFEPLIGVEIHQEEVGFLFLNNGENKEAANRTTVELESSRTISADKVQESFSQILDVVERFLRQNYSAETQQNRDQIVSRIAQAMQTKGMSAGLDLLTELKRSYAEEDDTSNHLGGVIRVGKEVLKKE